MSPKKATRKSAKSTTATGKTFKGFSDEERAAMKERAQELMVNKADGESAVLAKIAAMQGPDRALGERLHAIIKASVPALSPKTRYGLTEEFSDFKTENGLTLPRKYRLFYSATGQQGTTEIEWMFVLNEFAYNQKLDPKTFEPSTN